MQDREAALALGCRVAVAASRENDANPVLWLAGQDYRAADAARAARLAVTRAAVVQSGSAPNAEPAMHRIE